MIIMKSCRIVSVANRVTPPKNTVREVLGPCPRTKKAVEYESNGNINC